jgi:hypothetical protein
MLRRVLIVPSLKDATVAQSRKIAGIIGFALVMLDPISGCVCPRPWITGLRVHTPPHGTVCWRPPPIIEPGQ